MNQKLLLCLSLFVCAGAIPKVQAIAHGDLPSSSLESYENKPVDSIDIKIENLPKGSSFDTKTILSKLRTQKGDPFSQQTFDVDLKSLAEEYDKVEPFVHVSQGKLQIGLKIWLRPMIRSIDWSWEGAHHIAKKTLQKELDVKPGTVFNRTQFNKSFNKVKEYYIKKGYFESQLYYKEVPDPETQEIDIQINVIEGRSGKVESIVFNGFTKNEESDILDKLYTKKYSLLTSWFTGMGTFNEEALEQDRLAIFNYLQDLGYADARVQINILESEQNGKIILEINTKKGALYYFGNVSFDGNILFSDEEIEKSFIARPEGLYSPEKLRKTTEALKDLYGRKGFIDTSVTYETQLLQDTPIYNVHFQIDEGREYRIGMIRVIGNTQTESRVILRESLLVPGETFDSLKLKVTQARLENVGYFKSVNVYAVRTQDDLSLGDNYRDIYIEVEEQQTGNISLFSGFSSADNIFGGLDLTERNFNYKGITRVLKQGPGAVRGGGEYLHMRASLGKKQQNYLVSWLTPYFLDSLWRIGFEFNATLNSKLQSNDYDINTYNLGASIAYPLSPYWTYGVRYRVRNIDIKVDIDNKKVEKQQQHNNGILSGLGTSLGYDSTDSALKPHRGLRSILEGEFVGVGGDISFFRTAYMNAFYTPLWRKGYMRYRWEARFIFPFWKSDTFNKIPLSERFFLGGVGSVRGYRDFILGPRFKEIKENGEKKTLTKDPTGGISSSLLSVEYIQDIFKFLEAFAFIDAGYVTNKQFALGTYRMSYGVGVNIDVLGRLPVTLGYGFPVNAKTGQANQFFFTMGGQF